MGSSCGRISAASTDPQYPTSPIVRGQQQQGESATGHHQKQGTGSVHALHRGNSSSNFTKNGSKYNDDDGISKMSSISQPSITIGDEMILMMGGPRSEDAVVSPSSTQEDDVSRLLFKMEARMGLTPEEIEQVNRIVKASSDYLHTIARSKIIQSEQLLTSPNNAPLVYPSSPRPLSTSNNNNNNKQSFHLDFLNMSPASRQLSPFSPTTISSPTADNAASPHSFVEPSSLSPQPVQHIQQQQQATFDTPALILSTSHHNYNKHARLFDLGSQTLPSVTAVMEDRLGVSTGISMDMESCHMDDPHLAKMIEESRKKCYQSWLVWRCWKSVLDREDTGLETSFVELFHKSASHVLGGDRTSIMKNFVTCGKPVMEMFTKLIELGLDSVESVYMLHQLGARHVAYGVTRQDYEAYTGPFVRTIEMCARPGTINSQIRILFRRFWQRATTMMLEGAVESRGSASLMQAPKGTEFAIVFTDIEGSTALWENQPIAMEKAVDEHHKLVRDLIHDHGGYEVKTIGDSFMIAFKGLADAVTMALRLQVELLRASVDGLQIDSTKCESSGPPEVWNSSAVRVRVGVHWCTDASPKFDVVYKRYDYYGNDVNVAARVQDAACGGQVLVSEATLNAIQQCGEDLVEPNEHCHTMLDVSRKAVVGHNKASLRDVLQTSTYIVDAELKGIQEPITLHSLYPKVLEGRVYGIRNKDVFSD